MKKSTSKGSSPGLDAAERMRLVAQVAGMLLASPGQVQNMDQCAGQAVRLVEACERALVRNPD